MAKGELASWIFGGVSLVYLLGIVTYLVVVPRPAQLSPIVNFILGFLCAIAAGFCAYFFTGELGLDFQIPGTDITGAAVGGFAGFVLVLLSWLHYGPFRRHANRSPSVNITINNVAESTLKAMDTTLSDTEQVWKTVEAIRTGQWPGTSVEHRLETVNGRTALTFTHRTEVDRNPLQVLTIDQVKEKLSRDEMQRLLDTEASMRRKLKAWKKEKRKVTDPAAANIETKKRLLRLAIEMKADLDSIFRLIEQSLSAELQDHYQNERWLADTAHGILQGLELEKALPNSSPANPSSGTR